MTCRPLDVSKGTCITDNYELKQVLKLVRHYQLLSFTFTCLSIRQSLEETTIVLHLEDDFGEKVRV